MLFWLFWSSSLYTILSHELEPFFTYSGKVDVPLASHTVYLAMSCLFLDFFFSIRELLTSACDALFPRPLSHGASRSSVPLRKNKLETQSTWLFECLKEKPPRLHRQCKSLHILMNVSPIIKFITFIIALHIVIWPTVHLSVCIPWNQRPALLRPQVVCEWISLW